MPRVERFFAGQNVADWMGGSLGGAASTPITATGGTTNTYTGYKSHKFTSSGTFTVSEGSGEIQVLIVGGGGAGGQKLDWASGGGGGGAGGMRTGSLFVEAGSYTVTVGAGGAASADSTSGSSSSMGIGACSGDMWS